MEDVIAAEEIAEVFGVDSAEESGSQSAAESGEEGAVSQDTQTEEVASGAQESEEIGETDTTAQEAQGNPHPVQENPLGPEEQRRQAAEDAALRREIEQQRRDAIYAEMFAGQNDPYTGKPITTEAEWRAYQAERSRRQQAAQMEKAGIDPKLVQSMVDQQLQPIRTQLEAAKMENMRRQAQAANQRAQVAINAALKNISAIDPDIKTMEDIAKMPTAPRFNQLVKAGIGLEDAFYLANRQAIENRKIAAAREAVRSQSAGKRHLAPVGNGSGREAVEVPKEARDAYLEIMPDATDAEIREMWMKYSKDMQ